MQVHLLGVRCTVFQEVLVSIRCAVQSISFSIAVLAALTGIAAEMVARVRDTVQEWWLGVPASSARETSSEHRATWRSKQRTR